MHDIAQMMMMAAAGQGGQVSRTVGGTAFRDSTIANNYTTAALAIGAATADRLVVVAATVRDRTGNSIPTTTAMTIGGVSATLLARYGGWTTMETSLWIAAVPTGTTAAVAATIDRNVDDYALGVLAVYGAVPTPAYTVASAPSSGGGTITGVRNGLVIAATAQQGAYFNTGNVTVDFNTGNMATAQCATALPASTGAVTPLYAGTNAAPYVAAALAPI